MPPREAESSSAPICSTVKSPTTNKRSRRTLPSNSGTSEMGINNSAKSGELIAIDVGPEGNAAEAHLPQPVNLSVERQVLQDAKGTHQKTKKHREPHELFPVFHGAERLCGEKQHDGVGQEQLELGARAVGKFRVEGSPLHEYQEHQRAHGQQQRRNHHLFFAMGIDAQGPSHQQY